MKGMTRPIADVLPESAIVPPGNIRTPPAHFTHELSERTPFWYRDAEKKNPDGELRAGAKVIVDSRDGKYAWITDDRGLHVQIVSASLVPST